MPVNYTIERAETAGEKLFVLTVNDTKVFYVGELICWIIEKLSDGKSKREIHGELNRRYEGEYEFSQSKVDYILDEQIPKLGIFDDGSHVVRSTNSPLSNIKGKWTITTFEMIKPVISRIQFLFRPAMYWTLFILLFAANFYFMYIIFTKYIHMGGPVQSLKQCGKGLDFLMLFYPCAFVILYTHEIGHAAASYCYKVIPKNIGTGFYLIFPVLYTELNGVWKLDRAKRTIINTAGIFVQLFLNLLLIYFVFNTTSSTGKHVAQYLIQMNIFTIFLNVNPFLKFDGYWISSDLSRLPNLRQQSNYYLVKIMKFLFPKGPFKLSPSVQNSVNPKHPFLIIYSFLKYCFFGYIFFAIPRGLVRSVGTLYNLVVNQLIAQGDHSVCTIEGIVKTVFGLSILGYFMYKPLKSLVLSITKYFSR
jgi:putative peptide zinc metalloprotease protein